MKDFYQILGVTRKATPKEIKYAYRKKALEAHPDKGGDEEQIKLINEAYDILYDVSKRRTYDSSWNAFLEANVDSEPNIVFDGYLQAGDTPPYSSTFKEEHSALVAKYYRSPLKKRHKISYIDSFNSNIYSFEEYNGEIQQFNDVFSLIQAKNSACLKCEALAPTDPLTPVLAIKIFMDFLAGHYYGLELSRLKTYLIEEINKNKAFNPALPELLFYEGMLEIISMIDNAPEERHTLLQSLKKITDFAKNTNDALMPCILPLFYNKFYRNLYVYALNLYWDSLEDFRDEDYMDNFDGTQEAKDQLNNLKEKLENSLDDKQAFKLIRYIKMLYRFDQDVKKNYYSERKSFGYRKKAFHLLDWVPAFRENSSKDILANMFLQIGIHFQKAAMSEARLGVKMADESLALKMYLTAYGIAHHSTPEVELYINTQIVKYLSAFECEDKLLQEAFKAVKKRSLSLADVFPFFATPQANVAILMEGEKTIHLMRRLLNAMTEIYEYNKTHSNAILIEHSAVTILYQAYEACLKKWYTKEYDPATEKKFRLDLMDELLFDKGWTFLDVEQNIDSEWIMVGRDRDGWIKPSRSLPYVEDPSFIKYRNINGIEINNKTGEINFFMTPWAKDRPIYEKVFTIFDLQQMLERNVTGAIFSLDPVDPDKPFHPFNLMQFAPPQLCDSELLNTMLLTDYILKFLTTNQEVQGQYPFEQRPVNGMIKHLPEYLRKIITDFHKEQHAGALHRFWIEAEEIDLSISDKDRKNPDITRIGLGEIKMVVKKHRMERDMHGELKDVGNEDEGWPIYVLTPEQWLALNKGRRKIEGSAMIFIHAEAKLFYWENHKVVLAHKPTNFNESLIRLYLLPRNKEGKIDQNTKNMPLTYRVTRKMARQSGMPHRYSPEFIFAHKFTVYYDDFTQYLPEFGRLKELSKMSALIRVLNGIRQSNQESLQALDYLLYGGSSSSSSNPSESEVYQQYKQNYDEAIQSISSNFDEWRSQVATSVLKEKWTKELGRIKSQIGTLEFSSYSEEVEEICREMYNQISRDNPYIPSYRIWDEAINPKRAEFARQLSEAKQTNCRNQIKELFSSSLSSLGYYTYESLIDAFMRGEIKPLAKALVEHEKHQIQVQIMQQFPYSSTKDIASAIDDYGWEAAKRIGKEEACRQFRKVRDIKDKVETGFRNIHLGKYEEASNQEGLCFWVPASVRHEVTKDSKTGLNRFSFFVYGGVSIQPRINHTSGGGGPLGGNSVGGGSFNRSDITRGFQLHHIVSETNRVTRSHQLFQSAGMSLNSVANKIYLPTNPDSHPSRSIHLGRHTNSYSVQIGRDMDRILAQGQSAGWSQQQYREATRTMLADLRQELRAGNIGLNKHHRPWATKW